MLVECSRPPPSATRSLLHFLGMFPDDMYQLDAVWVQVEVQPEAALDFVLSHIERMLDPGDKTAPTASDADLVMLPQTLLRLYTALKVFHTEDDAFSKILVAQVAHLKALLAKRSFATLLILAQQANMLFSSGHKEAAQLKAPLKPLLSWISDQQVAQQLLGANLHQRQYVDALRDFLLYLTKSGNLADTTITKLIANMLQVCYRLSMPCH